MKYMLGYGNPALNPGVWELYKRQIGGATQAEAKTPQMSVHMKKLMQDFGTMKTDESYACTFVLTNTGSIPLVITDVKTTCGCTVPTWDRQPVAPGATTEVKVEVKPDALGSFRKAITVYGNVENISLQLLIIGEVTN